MNTYPLCKDGTPSHHWLIGELGGQPKDMAVCKLCGITRPMPSAFVDVPYEELQRRTFGRGKEERGPISWNNQGREV